MINPVSQFTKLSWLVLSLAFLTFPPHTFSHTKPSRIAVMDFGSGSTGIRAPAIIREALHANANEPATRVTEFEIVDRDQARVAALGIGHSGSLNLSLSEARDLGAAIGCDYYFLGDAQTLLRSPAEGPPYYESYASIFLVSARTGRLVLWERPEFRGATPNEAEQALLSSLAAEDTRQRHTIAIRRAAEDEREARARAIEVDTPVIEVMTDDETNDSIRAPRPYRRLKPPYPEAAARAEVEATVDVLVDIDTKGQVGHIEIARWAGYGLDQSVIDTVKKMYFFPAKRDGVAISMRVLLRYNFRKPAQR